MAVEVYKGRLFQYGHERRALGRFLQILKSKFGYTPELYIVVIEVDANGAAIDLLLICPRALIIADLKELTAASEKDATSIQVTGKANGVWEYTIPGRTTTIPLGGSANQDKNPYKQIGQMRFKFSNWLADKLSHITGNEWNPEMALDHLHGWAVLSPGFDRNVDQLELPWDEIKKKHNWFKVISLEQLAWEFHCTTDNYFELTEREMHAIVKELGAIKVENWGEILPDHFPADLPPIPISTLFSRLPLLSSLIGRDEEVLQLLAWVEDPALALIALKGMGGIGKTSLLGCLGKHVEEAGWQIKYIACREKELTAETFLAAIAYETGDRMLARLILDKGIPLLDRLDIALDHLEKRKILLVIDDFQKITALKEVTDILLRIPARSTRLKVIIASRDHPDIIDDPRLPFGVTRELSVGGLSKENIPFLFEGQLKDALTQQRIDWIWGRTNGNPYAIGLLRPLITNSGWGFIPDLPLYQNDKEHWFDTLVETLDKDVRLLAGRISVIRTPLTVELISYLSNDSKRANSLIFELVDKYIIQNSGTEERFSIHEYIRDYLYDHFNDPKQRIKAHLDAGNYYKDLSKNTENDYQMGDALYEAVYHFELAGQEDEILQLAQISFLSLYTHGDWDRAHVLAKQALKAAHSKNRALDISHWLVTIARWEFDHDNIKEAEKDLQQAIEQLPKLGPKTTDKDKHKIQEIKARIFAEQGRLAYYGSEFDEAKELFNEAMSISKEISSDPLVADCLMRIARIERQKGDFANSKLHFEEAMHIAQKINNNDIVVQAISHLALIARQENDYHAAKEYFSDAYQYAKKMDDWRGMEINRSLLADLDRRQGDYGAAARMFQECLDDSRKVGNGVAIRINLGQLAETLIRMGNFNDAGPLLDEAEDRSQKAGDGIGIAWTFFRRGLLLKKQGNLGDGDKLIHLAIEKLKEIGSKVYIRDFEKELGPTQDPLPGIIS